MLTDKELGKDAKSLVVQMVQDAFPSGKVRAKFMDCGRVLGISLWYSSHLDKCGPCRQTSLELFSGRNELTLPQVELRMNDIIFVLRRWETMTYSEAMQPVIWKRQGEITDYEAEKARAEGEKEENGG